MTPYSASAFNHSLCTFSLLNQYPELVAKLSHGFPIGHITPLSNSLIPSNHPNVIDYHKDIRAYILDELRLGRFASPFTPLQLFSKISPFRSSPFQIVAKPGLNSTPPKIQVCGNLSHRGLSGLSINDEINSDDFPTRWGSAELTAFVVSLFFSCALPLC